VTIRMISIRHICCLLILSFTCSSLVDAQSTKAKHYWLMLNAPKSLISNQQSQVQIESLGITDRAIKRRTKSLPQDRIIDELDYPVSQNVISKIEQTGAKIRTVSRWLNAVSVEATPLQMVSLKSLQCISSFNPIAALTRSRPVLSDTSYPQTIGKKSNTTGLDYGYSETQLKNIKVIDLHSIGVNGKGVLIGLLDDGFNNYRAHNALKNIDVVATHDFIHNISDVNRQPWEVSEQGNHGEGVLSSIGGFENGQIIGAAYGASFLLAKTEMDSSGSVDFYSEEDTYVAALEWAERLGADITSSSLGYKEFTPLPTYTSSDMNGRTTKVAQAAVIAARKGVLVLTAMGNEGYLYGKIGQNPIRKDTTLVSPADADSIISVGSTSSDGWLATSSGTGPTADGRIKPEVVAQGMGVYWASGTVDYRSVSGTSCSTPLVAGAAALVLSAHPQLTNMQVRYALMNTAIHLTRDANETASYPNNYYGWGFIDAYAAASFYGSIMPIVDKLFQNYPNPFNRLESTKIKVTSPIPMDCELTVFNILGQRIRTLFRGTILGQNTFQWDGTNENGCCVTSGVYFARLKTPDKVFSTKMLFLK
jgi:serine protease AprX